MSINNNPTRSELLNCILEREIANFEKDNLHSLYRMSSDLQSYLDEMIKGQEIGDMKWVECNRRLASAMAEALLYRIGD